MNALKLVAFLLAAAIVGFITAWFMRSFDLHAVRRDRRRLRYKLARAEAHAKEAGHDDMKEAKRRAEELALDNARLRMRLAERDPAAVIGAERAKAQTELDQLQRQVHEWKSAYERLQAEHVALRAQTGASSPPPDGATRTG